MVKLYIGITDFDWFRFLRETPGIAEVNFWQPGGKTNFRALRELFLFKLHAPRHFIVGSGIFVHANVLPISVAWDTFGISNGAPSLEIMKERVARYLNQQVDPSTEYSVGCRILAEPFFLPENEWIPVPPSWSRYIQTRTSGEFGRHLQSESGLPANHRLPNRAGATPRSFARALGRALSGYPSLMRINGDAPSPVKRLCRYSMLHIFSHMQPVAHMMCVMASFCAQISISFSTLAMSRFRMITNSRSAGS